MTKKKNPEDLKKRGRPTDEYDNGDLSAHLAGIVHLKDLNFEAQTIIRKTVKEFNDKTNSDRAYDTKSILFLVVRLSRVTTASVKQTIDSSDKFDCSDYGKTSVNNYKQVLVAVAKRLSELKEKKGTIRKDQRNGEEYYSDSQLLKLISLMEEGGSVSAIDMMIEEFKKEIKGN
ncbi:hypothetical protein ACOJDJ_000127 [Cronobacter dublinensis]